MPALYVENVPQPLYDALRDRAKRNRSSIAMEVISLLRENIPTAEELAQREQVLRLARRFQSRRAPARRAFASTEQMQREDRAR